MTAILPDVATSEEVEDLIPPVSNSELQTFGDCKRRWYLTYYREMGVKKSNEPLTGALAFGSRIHVALERKYKNGENPVDVFEELNLYAIYLLLQQERELGYRQDAAREKLRKERELGFAMLEGYEAWVEEEGVDEGLKLAGAEVTVIVASGIPGVRIRGKLDQRIYREIDGGRLFLDFKTAGDLRTGPQMLPIDEQMKFYMLLEKLDALAKTGDEPPEPTMGGLYRMLKKVKRTGQAKPPFYDQVEVHHNQRELESMMLRTQKRILEIIEIRQNLDADGDHRYWVPPRPTRDCTWKCPFMAICPMMDDSREEVWNAMLNDYYEPTDPYARYDEDDIKS